MDQPDTRYCPNCYYPLPDFGEICSHCGQKYTTGKVSFWSLVKELLESVFNVDSKIFHTLGALFVPGRLTQAYFRGQQNRYVSPLRLFLVLAVAHIATLGFLFFNKLEEQVDKTVNNTRQAAYRTAFMEEFGQARDEVLALFPETQALPSALDSLSLRIKAQSRDSSQVTYFVRTNLFTLESRNIEMATKDLIEMPLDSLPIKYGITDFWHGLQLRQWAKLNRQGGSFARFALGKLIWLIALMMPILALLLKLLYIRRRRYYVEHLVFSFHLHAFFFLLLSVLLLALPYTPGHWDWEAQGIGIAALWIVLYIYWAMRRFYRQGRFKTFIKLCAIGYCYVLIFVVSFLLMAVVTTLTF